MEQMKFKWTYSEISIQTKRFESRFKFSGFA